mgnify:CR=1 FL=1
MRSFLTRLMTEEDGATMVEYALMVALIAAGAITVVTGLGTAINTKFSDVSTAVGSAKGGQ